jgi:hypothetical protein
LFFTYCTAKITLITLKLILRNNSENQYLRNTSLCLELSFQVFSNPLFFFFFRSFNQLISTDFTTNGNHGSLDPRWDWLVIVGSFFLIYIRKVVAQNVVVTNCSIDLTFVYLTKNRVTKRILEVLQYSVCCIQVSRSWLVHKLAYIVHVPLRS